MTDTKKIILILAMFAIEACTLLPRNGPNDKDILEVSSGHTKDDNKVLGYEYVVVDVTRETIPHIRKDVVKSLSTLRSAKPPKVRLGPADVVRITVFEDQSGGLFIPDDAGSRPGNFVTLPAQKVQSDGRISVPYAGSIIVSGKTPIEVEELIRDKLSAKAINPDVSLEVIQDNYPRASVVGVVENDGVFALRNGGDRILDIIAQAGGVKGEEEDIFVRLSRGIKSIKIPYATLTENPRENIFVLPGDLIHVSREHKKFYTFGAAGQVGEFEFTSPTVNLNTAIAKSIGLLVKYLYIDQKIWILCVI